MLYPSSFCIEEDNYYLYYHYFHSIVVTFHVYCEFFVDLLLRLYVLSHNRMKAPRLAVEMFDSNTEINLRDSRETTPHQKILAILNILHCL